MPIWNNVSFHFSTTFICTSLGDYDYFKDMQDGLRAMVLAYLISPYGIPILAHWLIGKIGKMNERLKLFNYLRAKAF